MPQFPPEPHAAGAVRAPASPAQAADALVDLIGQAAGRIVVVVGARNSGKTQFIREDVVPRLRAAGSVFFFDCASEITREMIDAVSQPGAVVILDSFERFLRLPQAAREPGLVALLVPKGRATVVLVSGKQCLSDLLDLRRLAPDILDHLFELEELRLAIELPRYRPPQGSPAVEWEETVIDALETDLAGFADRTVTPSLVAIIYQGFQDDAYDPKRGLVGFLERHLEAGLARLNEEPAFGEAAVDVARALLKEIAAGGERSTLSLDDVARRLDVSAETAAKCHRWLIDSGGLLRESTIDGLVFQPPQLRAVLQKGVEEDRNTCARAERYVADGLEGRLKIGTLLPRERFEKIHAQRTLLRTTPEQSCFLTLCALDVDPERDPGPVNYWFRRIGDSTLEVGTLVEALADPSDKARARAALMLGCVDEPRVHGHLCQVALEDDAPDVRQQAITSLSGFVNKGPIRDVLTREAKEGAIETRVRAIEALRIFKDEECARLLEAIVSSPNELTVREAAIRALARTQSETGTFALVRIALNDADQGDRDRARVALSHLGSENLTDFGLNATLDDWVQRRPVRSGRWWKKLGHWPAVLIILICGLVAHGFPLLLFRRWVAGVTFFAIEVASIALARFWSDWFWLLWVLNWCASIAAAAWAARRQETPPGSFSRALSNALLANTMLTGGLLLHGVGHWITGRRRQAWQLIAVEIVAVVAILPTFFLENLFNIAIVRDGFDRLTQALLYTYRLGFLISWVWSVSSLAVAERWGPRGPWLSERHSGVLRALLNAPVSAGVLRRKLVAGEPEARSARMLMRQFGDAVPGNALLRVVEADIQAQRPTPPDILECLARFKHRRGYETVVTRTGELFDRLPAGERARLFDVLVKHPTDASIQCLSERRGALRPRERVRRLWASIVLPFRDWHWTVRLAAAAGALLALLLIVDAVRTSGDPGWPEIKELRRLSQIRSPDASGEIATVAAFLAKRHPLKSVTELATLLREVEEGRIPAAYASSIAASLGLVATFQVPEDVRQDSDSAAAARFNARTAAVTALVQAALHAKNEPVRAGAMQALQQAAQRGGSRELVTGLATLFDGAASPVLVSVEQARKTEALAGIAAMLESVAQPPKDGQPHPAQLEARKAIAERAERFAELLRTSADVNVKRSALGALQASGDEKAVNAIKSFVLSDRVPLQPGQLATGARPDPQEARAADALAREQQTVRAMAVDALRAIRTPAAVAALLDLKDTAALPDEIATKVRHVAAQELNDQAIQALRDRDLDRALKQSRGAVDADDNFAEAHGTLGAVLYQRGDLDESLKQFKVATDREQGYAWAYYMQAVILGSRADYKDAERALMDAIRTDPNYPWSYRLLVDIYHSQGRDGDVVALLRSLQAGHPTVAEIYVQLAYVYHERIVEKDPAAYQLAYEANQQLLALIGDGDPVQALTAKMNLLECRLTTGRYRELIQKVPELLTRVGTDPDQRMALNVLMLAAQVLENDSRGALNTLAELGRIYNADFKSSGKWHNWVYDGTERYLEKQVPSTARTEALVELVRAANGTSIARRGTGAAPVIPEHAFNNMRAVLESVK